MPHALSDLPARHLAQVLHQIHAFDDRVYWIVQQVPRGKVVTYGQVALLAGSPRAARAVGNLLKRSLHEPIDLPWHRVINSRGGISWRGDLARAELQRRLLFDEGVEFSARGRCRLPVYRWQPSATLWEGIHDAHDNG